MTPKISKCVIDNCRNKAKDGRICSTCRTRRQRKNSPFRYYYQKLKHRAKERGKPFNLCFEQFKLIWLCEPEKWESKCTDKETKWQMDCIINHEGYHFNNIQLITKQRNVRKYYTHDRFVVDARWTPRKQESTVHDRAPF